MPWVRAIRFLGKCWANRAPLGPELHRGNATKRIVRAPKHLSSAATMAWHGKAFKFGAGMVCQDFLHPNATDKSMHPTV